MPDPVAPTAPTDEPSDPADGAHATPADPAAGAATDGPSASDPTKKKTVKKIVKKVPVATRAGGARPSTDTRPSPPTRTAVPLAKDDDHRSLPPPPAAAATAAPTTARRPPPPAVATPEEVRRVGPVKRRRLGRLRARKVRRILRHVEVWSVLKVSVVFYFCLWLVLLVSGAVVWKVATQAGLIDNVENFLQESGFDEVNIDGETMFRAWATGGFIMVFATTGFTVLLAVLFNLISDLMGGVRFTVIELETIRRRKPNRPRRDAARPANRP